MLQTRSRIEKLLELENWRLYNKVLTCDCVLKQTVTTGFVCHIQLGLNLKLHSEQNPNNLREHVSSN